MPETIRQISEQLTEKWEEIEKANKIKILAATGIILLIIISLFIFLNKPKMVVLIRDIESKQASEASDILEAESIEYKLENDGTTILVEEKDLNKSKLIMAREDIPKGRFTFEDALSNSMSTTESEKQTKLHKAKENQISATLETIEGVKSAQANLVVPDEDNSFLESKQKATAAVILELSNPLTNKQVNGIANFVSRSVKNLSTEDINIIDTEGNNLYIGSEADLEGDYSKQQEQKIFAEQDLKNKVADLMSKMYDDVRVSPNLVFDYDEYIETKEEFKTADPDSNKGIVTEDKTLDSSSTNTQVGEEPGLIPNEGDIPDYVIGGGGDSDSKTKSREAKYAVDKTVSNLTRGVGKLDLDSSSVAVHVFTNKTYYQEDIEAELEEGQTWKEFKDENKNQNILQVDDILVDSIEKATGLQNVAVQAFENPVFVDKEAFELSPKDYIPYVLLVLFLLALGYGIYRFTNPDEIVELEPELSVEDMLQSAKEQQEDQLENIEYSEELETKRHIEKFVDEKPDAVANLLRNWLTDDEWE